MAYGHRIEGIMPYYRVNPKWYHDRPWGLIISLVVFWSVLFVGLPMIGLIFFGWIGALVLFLIVMYSVGIALLSERWNK